MRGRFDRELEALNNQLIEMGSLVEAAIDKAVKALIEQDTVLAKAIIEGDREINEKERAIESQCLRLLLQQQPVATDLRFISTALKMITDMERIGDQAADIAEITVHLSEKAYLIKLIDIPKMAEATVRMVRESIDAFVARDLSLAKQVIESDDIVDELFCRIKDSLIELIRESADYGEQATDFLMIAKYFERIGDHAVNIAGWVQFAITGAHSEKTKM
ncbi:MAG: phosphate signaling complex protein PhoU [Clostridia bacterium]|nr:phosphate signaling complex protein PhoU [Clostridia bacterium]